MLKRRGAKTASCGQGRRKDFFQGGQQWIFSGVPKDVSRRWPKIVKFLLNHSKVGKDIIGKCQI